MDLLKKIFIIFAMAATVMPAVAGDSDSIDSRKARREIVHKSIKDAVKGAKQLNTDSIRQQVAQVVSDEFSDTLFEWEKSSDWDSGRSKTGIKAGKLMEELDGLGNGEAAVAIVIIFLIFSFGIFLIRSAREASFKILASDIFAPTVSFSVWVFAIASILD